MTIVFSLCLPRDSASVPVVRHLVSNCLQRLGVTGECSSDVEIAVTEACSNVLIHAKGSSDEYEVNVEVNNERCEIRVTDTGTGFDHEAVEEASAGSESGRGIQLMRGLVDSVKFSSQPERGTIVHLVKELALTDKSILRPAPAAP
jgi:serine/threonine-protein kinase RsbW